MNVMSRGLLRTTITSRNQEFSNWNNSRLYPKRINSKRKDKQRTTEDKTKISWNKEIMTITKKYSLVKKIKMDEEDTPRKIFYIKYRGEEDISKAQAAMKYESKKVEVSTIEER